MIQTTRVIPLYFNIKTGGFHFQSLLELYFDDVFVFQNKLEIYRMGHNFKIFNMNIGRMALLDKS